MYAQIQNFQFIIKFIILCLVMNQIQYPYTRNDLEYFIKSLHEGTLIEKSESLKKLNNLIIHEKKQISFYGKRLLTLLNQLIQQSREDINILASNLTLSLLNLNLRDIQFYLRNKLLRTIIKNLGDSKSEVRKVSHYCLLTYVRVYRSFNQVISNYIHEIQNSESWQLKQKCINSFQSILVLEIKFLNWNSVQFRKIFEMLIQKLNAESAFVQKAAEQCILTLCKNDNIKLFSKKLSPVYLNLLKIFLELQHKNGIIQQINLDQQTNQIKPSIQSPVKKIIHNQNSENAQSIKKVIKIEQLQFETIQIENPKKRRSLQIKSVIDKQQVNRKNSESKIESIVKNKYNTINTLPEIKSIENKNDVPNKSNLLNLHKKFKSNVTNNTSNTNKLLQKIESIQNQSDAKIKLSLLQAFQNKLLEPKNKFDVQLLIKSMVPMLEKLLKDSNIKISLYAIKLIQGIIQNYYEFNQIRQLLVLMIQQLSDTKITMKQVIYKSIKNQLLVNKNLQTTWITLLLETLNNTNNHFTKQEILNIIYKLIQEDFFSKQHITKIISGISVGIENAKNRIKIKTLDCLVLITLKSENIDQTKNIVRQNIDSIHYDIYIEVLNRQLKNNVKWNNLVRSKMTKNSTVPLSSDSNIITKSMIQINLDRSTAQSQKISKRYHNSNIRQKIEMKTLENDNLKSQNHIGQKKNISQISRINFKTNTQNGTPLTTLQKFSNITIDTNFHINENDKQKIQTNSKLKSIEKRIKRNYEAKSIQYADQESLKQFQYPDKQLKTCLEQLKQNDWQTNFEAINKLRRIIHNHKQILISSQLHPIVQSLLMFIQSLRSSLSKNAIITLNELTNKLLKLLDPELNYIFQRLIKKSMDTNSFILNEVNKTLLSLCINSSQSKIMNLLLSYHQVKSIPVKQTIVFILEQICFIPKFLDREMQKILLILKRFLNQGSLEIRERTQYILLRLLETNKCQLVQKFIPAEQLNKIKKKQQKQCRSSFNSYSQQRHNDKIDVSLPKIQTFSSVFSKKSKKMKTSMTVPKQLQELEIHLEKLNTKQWKQKLESMKQIFILLNKYPKEITHYRYSSKLIDILSKQINQSNMKITNQAFSILLFICKNIPTLIQNNLSIVTLEIFTCFGSTKNQIRKQVQNIFDNLRVNIQSWMLFQYLCNGALYSIQKARPTIIKKIIQLSQQVYTKKPMLFKKNIQKTIQKLLDETKPEMMIMIQKLINICQQLLGNQIFLNMKPKIKEYLNLVQ